MALRASLSRAAAAVAKQATPVKNLGAVRAFATELGVLPSGLDTRSDDYKVSRLLRVAPGALHLGAAHNTALHSHR